MTLISTIAAQRFAAQFLKSQSEIQIGSNLLDEVLTIKVYYFRCCMIFVASFAKADGVWISEHTRMG
jgi:hypothetical protein